MSGFFSSILKILSPTQKRVETHTILSCDDGSYDLDLIIEFSPQRYFYIGLIISGITLLSCFGYLGYVLLHRKKPEAGGVPGWNKPKNMQF